MDLVKNLAIGLVFIGVVGGGYYLFNQNSGTTESTVEQTVSGEQLAETTPEREAASEMSPDEEADEVEQASTARSGGSYQVYSETAFAEADDQDRVLFFAASWCPTCQMADREFTNKTAELPDGVAIFKADFDQDRELKSRYNIVTQHTFVQVDSAGEEVNKWVGGDIAALHQRLI